MPEFESFKYVLLDRESYDEFHLDVASKDENLFVSLILNLNQICEIINFIISYLEDPKLVLTPKYVAHLQLDEENGKTLLHIMVDNANVILYFKEKNELEKLLAELKIASKS